MCIEKFFSHAKKSNLAIAATLPMARAFQRAVGSTCRRFFKGARGLGAPPPLWQTVADCGGTLCAHSKSAKRAKCCVSLSIKLEHDHSVLAVQVEHANSTNSTSATSTAHPLHCGMTVGAPSARTQNRQNVQSAAFLYQ